MLNLAISASYNTVKISEEVKLSKAEIKQEIADGLRIGVAHGLPMLLTLIAAKALLSSQNLDILNGSLLAACTLQFAAPAAVMALFKSKLHKNTHAMLWTALVLGGITNGVVFSFVMH